MSLLGRPLESITAAELQALIENKIIESHFIEYKADAGFDEASDKIKFLKTVSSFANAVGGDVLIGMRAKDGIPVEAAGLTRAGIDATKLKIEQLIQSGITPKLHTIVRTVDLDDQHAVLLIRIPRSWAKPHRVTAGGHDKFYGRHSAGAFPMDVDHLRMAFLLSASIPERVQRERHQLRERITSNTTPIKVNSTIALQLIPYDSFDRQTSVDLSLAYRLAQEGRLTPLGRSGSSIRYNADGIVVTDTATIDRQKNSGVVAYTQLYRTGIVESVNVSLLSPMSRLPSEHHFISSVGITEHVIRAVEQYMSLQAALELAPPVAVCLSLYYVKGYYLALDSLIGDNGYPIDRADLLLPVCTINSFDETANTLLQTAFDALWNAAGWDRCHFYDESGTFRSRR